VIFSEEMLGYVKEINSELEKLNTKIHSFEYFKNEIHISLSRTIFLKYFQHERFSNLFVDKLHGISK